MHSLKSLPRLARLVRPVAAAALLATASPFAVADPFIAPGDSDLRADLQLLSDAGVIAGPLTTWPLNWQSIIADLDEAEIPGLDAAGQMAYARIRGEMRIAEQTHRLMPHVRLGGLSEPVALRSFSAMPRDEGELEGGLSYTGDRLSFNLDVTRAFNAEDDWRFDGTYIGLAVRNWAVIAGYPERWWGPGMQGSLILSSNARPVPQIGIERISAKPFPWPGLRLLGPWSITSFIGELDDPRVIDDAKLFGMRMAIRPLPQLELAFSRTAQLCGDDRPCGMEQFWNMLLGKDNSGRNVNAADEPGNQLAGFDGRWAFSRRRYAIYWQWIGEDTRQAGPQIGSWLRLVGAEVSGALGRSGWRHRTYLEAADTTCQEGGGGFGGNKYNCAYVHGTYQTGYRYEDLPLGYPTDGDSESLAVISVLTTPAGAVWEVGAHSVRVNQGPVAGQPHSLSTDPASRYGFDVAHVRELPIGRIRVRVSVAEQRNQLTGQVERDSGLAVEWMAGYW